MLPWKQCGGNICDDCIRGTTRTLRIALNAYIALGEAIQKNACLLPAEAFVTQRADCLSCSKVQFKNR